MWTDIIERILAFILTFFLGFMGGCLAGGRGQVDGPRIAQSTSATQQTVQAAPDSVVNVTPHMPTSAASDP